MRPRDWFSVGVRLLSVYVFYRRIARWLGLIGDIFSQASKSELSRDLETSKAVGGYVLVFAVGYMALSDVLIFGAERLTRWAFNEPRADDINARPETIGVGFTNGPDVFTLR